MMDPVTDEMVFAAEKITKKRLRKGKGKKLFYSNEQEVYIIAC